MSFGGLGILQGVRAAKSAGNIQNVRRMAPMIKQISETQPISAYLP